MSILDRERVVPAIEAGPLEYYLDVYINGLPMGALAPIVYEAAEIYSMLPADLEQIGLIAQPAAKRGDGRVELGRLDGVTFVIDDAAQAIHFQASNAVRRARRISAARGTDPLDLSDPRNKVSYGYGALVNYSIAAHTGYRHEDSRFEKPAVSGIFSGRVFSPMGVVESGFALSGGDIRRLDSYWTWSDHRSMHTFRAGDLITGGLSWTRPSRLAGFQVQRNFGLRPGLITMPVPGFNSSAAVPSTVEIFVNDQRRYSGGVLPGPFEIVDMPVVSGQGTARVVVRDEDGNESVTESQYFVSNRLLRPGMLDYSLEAGVARTGFGSSFDRYGSDIFGSASMRYGVADWLTLEAHGEGGADLVNGGAGLVATIGSLGIGSFSAAGSHSNFGTGYQLNGSLEFKIRSATIRGRIQRAFGDYADIGRATEDKTRAWHGHVATPRSIDQVSLHMPAPFEMKGGFGLAYTQMETFEGRRSKLIGASFSRPLFGGQFSISGFTDLERDRRGIYAGFSIALGDTGIRSGTSVRHRDDRAAFFTTLSRQKSREDNDIGWRLEYGQADRTRLGGNVDWDHDYGSLSGSILHANDHTRGQARARGSVVAAGGSVFAAPEIKDAFAVVDAGAPGVPVLYENRRVTSTGAGGKAILPDLRSWQRNRIAIDTRELPVDIVSTHTRETVIPGEKTGVTVSFAQRGDSALVAFKDHHGNAIPVGTSVRLTGDEEEFMVGFDGEAFLIGVRSSNMATLTLPNGSICTAQFAYTPVPGRQTVIEDVRCR